MNPLEKRVKDLEDMVRRILRVEDIAFTESLRRRVLQDADVTDLPNIKLSDLSDVSDTDTASTGQVLKKTSTTWQPGTDEIGAS